MDKNFVVTKSNYFIKNSSYDLSIEEQRIILTLASMVQPEDQDFKLYQIKISDFIDMLGISSQTKYTELPKITKELMRKVFEISDEETGKLIQVAWLSAVIYEKNSGVIELEFSPHLKPYMLNLKGFYTKYKLHNVLSMKSKYSPRLYELLKLNEYQKKGFTVHIDELRKLFKAENIYPKYNDFKKYIILKAQEELELYSDIRFEFVECKMPRQVKYINFYVFKNTPTAKKKTNKTSNAPKTKKELNTDKIITEQEKDKIKAEKVKADFDAVYELFLTLPQEEQSQIELEAYNDFLKESESSDNKTLRGIFEKSKKPLIIKKFKEKKFKPRKKS
jgi:plasmid replication initiation protein